MKARLSAIAAVLTVVAALALAGPALADSVVVSVVDQLDLAEASADGAAVGLLVPGWGDTVSRAGAIEALESGRVRHPKQAGDDEPVIQVELGPREASAEPPIHVLLVLPPDGVSENDARYPIAVYGGGYGGLLYSPSTRIPGLVSIADVAPTELRLEGGEIPDEVTGHALGWRPSADPAGELRDLDSRLTATRDARFEATAAYAAIGLALAAVALLIRWPLAGRGALFALPAAAAVSIVLSLAGVTPWWAFTAVTAAATLGLAATARSRLAAGLVLIAVLAVYYAALLWEGKAVSLSLLGPNPDAGGRFYGLSNELETILVGTAIVAAALLWERLGPGALIGVGGLALVTVAPGRLGASVTGALVLVIGLAVLALDLEGGRGLLVVAAVVAAGAAAVLVASPGQLSGAGPGRLADRIELSARLSVDSLQSILLVYVFGLGVLLLVATRYRALRAEVEQADAAVLLALLVAVAISAVVNDSPAAVLGHGAGWCLMVAAWALAGSQARQSGASYRLAPAWVGLSLSRSRRSP